MKKIIALYGRADIGKSETIRSVYDGLIQEFGKKSLIPDYKHILPSSGDICVVLSIKGKLVAIESQGDPNSRLFKSLPGFVSLGCDIIICATRTRGTTVQAVEALTGYEVEWVKKVQSKKSSAYAADNLNAASKIISIVKKNLE